MKPRDLVLVKGRSQVGAILSIYESAITAGPYKGDGLEIELEDGRVLFVPK